MGLSYLSNSLSTELPQELLGLEDYLLQDDFTSDISIDSLFQQQQPTFISQPYDDNSSQLLLADNPNKRQKTACHYQYQDDVSNVRYDDVLISATDPFFEGCYGGGGCTGGGLPVFACGASERSGGRGGGGLSAQSIAARKRRRKIADKTQELGKLIPGGHRMNTAEMFQSAAMYVKFLQAQIGIISLSNSLLHVSNMQNGGSCYDDDDDEQRDLEVLVASPVVQEKLYSQEKCLVPMKLVQALSSDSKLQSEQQHAVENKQANNLLMTRPEPTN